MKRKLTLLLATIVAYGCGGGAEPTTSIATDSRPSADRGGTITVGDQTWTLVPSMQCSVYPNNQVNIAGHAANDPDFEITVDYYPDGDGPIGVTGGSYGRAGSWGTQRPTVTFTIEGKHVRGTATFDVITQQGQQTVDGSFSITC